MELTVVTRFLKKSGKDKHRSGGSVNDNVRAKVKSHNQERKSKHYGYKIERWVITRKCHSTLTQAYFHLSSLTPF